MWPFLPLKMGGFAGLSSWLPFESNRHQLPNKTSQHWSSGSADQNGNQGPSWDELLLRKKEGPSHLTWKRTDPGRKAASLLQNVHPLGFNEFETPGFEEHVC